VGWGGSSGAVARVDGRCIDAGACQSASRGSCGLAGRHRMRLQQALPRGCSPCCLLLCCLLSWCLLSWCLHTGLCGRQPLQACPGHPGAVGGSTANLPACCRVLHNIVGAAETTINQLLAALVLVGREPGVMQRLVEEQRQVGDGWWCWRLCAGSHASMCCVADSVVGMCHQR
jgi:hypothetical protein